MRLQPLSFRPRARVSETGLMCRGSRDSGYTIVVMAVIFTVMNVMLALALPSWSHVIQREKEEELIFRGLQYAEAIRVFQIRFKRLPVRLEELIEVEPRCLRQLWKNPMSKSGGWNPIFVAVPTQQGQRQGRGDQNQDQTTEQGQVPGSREAGTGEVKIGPIRGVSSPVGGDSIKSFDGKDDYGSWQFTVELLQMVPKENRPRGIGLSGVPTVETFPVNARDVGRPWPPGVTPLIQNKSLPPGRQLDGDAGKPGQPPADAGGEGDGRG